MADHVQVVRAVLEQWQEQGRPVTGALIQGSVAQHGYVTRLSQNSLNRALSTAVTTRISRPASSTRS
jgi:hypothetical protein